MKINIKVVPICISYDTIFDQSYISNDMISGKFEKTTMM